MDFRQSTDVSFLLFFELEFHNIASLLPASTVYIALHRIAGPVCSFRESFRHHQ